MKRYLLNWINAWVVITLLVGCQSVVLQSQHDLLPHIRKPTALLIHSRPSQLDAEAWGTLVSQVQERLSQRKEFRVLLTPQQQQQHLKASPGLRTDLRLYRTTLILTGISDRALANRLVPGLGVEQFLVFQVEVYPCTEQCQGPEQLLVRFILREPTSGEVVLRTRKNIQLEADDLEIEALKSEIIDLVDEVLSSFEDAYVVPWHQWRYEHLKPSDGRVLRSKLEL